MCGLCAQGSSSLATGAVAFANNYAFNPEVRGMPTGDISVELWARMPAHAEGAASNAFQTLLSYATHTQRASPGSPCARPEPCMRQIPLRFACNPAHSIPTAHAHSQVWPSLAGLQSHARLPSPFVRQTSYFLKYSWQFSMYPAEATICRFIVWRSQTAASTVRCV